MLTIRLSRIGKKQQIAYRLIISEKARDPYGRALEILGSYNPTTKTLQAKAERINYWISKGASLSPTVNNLLIKENIIKGDKVKATNQKKKKGEEEKKEVAPAKPKEDKPATAEVKTDEKKAEKPEEEKK